MLYRVQSLLPHSGGKNFRSFRTIHETFLQNFVGGDIHVGEFRNARARCYAYAGALRMRATLHNNWTGAIHESFLREIIVFVPKRESFLPQKFSAIRYVCASNCLL